jgi:hypothetical protein
MFAAEMKYFSVSFNLRFYNKLSESFYHFSETNKKILGKKLSENIMHIELA